MGYFNYAAAFAFERYPHGKTNTLFFNPLCRVWVIWQINIIKERDTEPKNHQLRMLKEQSNIG